MPPHASQRSVTSRLVLPLVSEPCSVHPSRFPRLWNYSKVPSLAQFSLGLNMNKRNCLWPICQMPPPTGEADGIPGKVVWKAVGKSSVILHWLEPPDPNGLILKYEIKYRRLGEVGSQLPLSHPGPAPPPASQPAVCAARRRPQCFVCPVFDMPKLVGSTWLCCLLETTLLKFGPPHWLAMAPGLTVLPSTSPVQVRQTCFPIPSPFGISPAHSPVLPKKQLPS